jgi:hypothetical protein
MSSVDSFYKGICVLVKRKLIDVTLVDDIMSESVVKYWEKFQPLIGELRTRMN